jgi:hypothetical protein
MRISSRGTVSMGPIGWALFIMFIGPFYLMFWTAKLLVLLILVIARAVAEHSPGKETR